jgi:hypothetical protein
MRKEVEMAQLAEAKCKSIWTVSWPEAAMAHRKILLELRSNINGDGNSGVC